MHIIQLLFNDIQSSIRMGFLKFLHKAGWHAPQHPCTVEAEIVYLTDCTEVHDFNQSLLSFVIVGTQEIKF